MRLKTSPAPLILGLLLFFFVCTLSFAFFVGLLHQRISQAFAAGNTVAHQTVYMTVHALRNDMRGPRPANPRAFRAEVAEALRNNTALRTLMMQSVHYSPNVLDVTIADNEGRGLISTDVANVDKPLPTRSEYSELQKGGFFQLLVAAFAPARVYNVTLPLELNSQPFATVRVGVSTRYMGQTLVSLLLVPWSL
jgi:hypothetical protein